MANTESAKKNVRKNETNRLRNKAARSKVRTYHKKARVTLLDTSSTYDSTVSAIRDFESVGMRVAKSNAVTRAAVSRTVSRLVVLMKKRFSAN